VYFDGPLRRDEVVGAGWVKRERGEDGQRPRTTLGAIYAASDMPTLKRIYDSDRGGGRKEIKRPPRGVGMGLEMREGGREEWEDICIYYVPISGFSGTLSWIALFQNVWSCLEAGRSMPRLFSVMSCHCHCSGHFVQGVITLCMGITGFLLQSPMWLVGVTWR
jgi:hypothetical protein